MKKVFPKFQIVAKICHKDEFYALLFVLSGRLMGTRTRRAGDSVCCTRETSDNPEELA